MQDEAIVRACAASLRWNYPSLSDADIAEMVSYDVDEMRAAVSAFLADVPVSERMVDAGGKLLSELDCVFQTDCERAEIMFKAMCAKLSEELNSD